MDWNHYYCSPNALDHPVSDQHKTCFNKYAKDKGLNLIELTEKYIEERQKNIVHGPTKISETVKELICHWIEVAYFTACQEISLAKFEQWIVLEKHDHIHGTLYMVIYTKANLIDLIGTVLTDKLSVKSNNINFF